MITYYLSSNNEIYYSTKINNFSPTTYSVRPSRAHPRERDECVVDANREGDVGLSRGAYMFASRNLLALERAKDAEREVCREGKGRYQHQ